MRYFLLLTVITFFLLPDRTYAQNFDIAYTYNLQDAEVQPGDIIIASRDQGLTRSDVAYDTRIFGIYQTDPVIVFRFAESSQSAIVRNGDTTVSVSDFNGRIKKGDYVTSSPILGKGMRAGQSGYVVGVATQDSEPTGETMSFQGKTYNLATVAVALKIEYAEISSTRSIFRFLEYLNAALFRNIQDPEKFTVILRYIVAGIVTMIGASFALLTVSRSLTKGVEAIGRNPLAKASIQFSIAMNVAMIVIVLIGIIILDFIIIKL